MSQEDTLRLAAEIVDKFSGPLRNMTKSVHQFDDLLKGHQVRSNVASKEQASRQKELNAQFVDTGRMVLGTINPAFAAMGLSVGAVAASTGLLIGQLRAAGDGFLKVQGAMRRTGMSNDGLEVWVRTLGKLGIDADEARGQLSSLGDVAARLHRNFSPQIQALESQFTNLSGLITNMSKASGAEASEMFWKYYLSHPAPPDQQRKLLAAVGLSPEIANATSDQIKEMIAKAQASVAAHPPIALETMNKIHEAFEEFDDIVKGFNLDLMNAFGGSGANAVKGFGEILHNEAEDIKYLITKAMEFNGWLDKIGGHGDVVGKIVTDMLHPEAAVKALAEKYPWLKNFSDEKLAFSFSGADLGGAGGDSFKDRWGSSDSEKTLTRGVKSGRHFGFRDDSPEQKQFDDEQKKRSMPFLLSPKSPVSSAEPNRGGIFPGGSYHPTSYMDGGSSGAEDLLSRSIKSGMLAAFREWFASTQAERGGGGGFTNANYSPDNDKIDNTPIGRAVRAARDAAEGKPQPGGGRRGLAKRLGMDRGDSGTGPVDRSSFESALNDPAFVRRMASMGKGEVTLESNIHTQRAIAEQAFNRWYVRKQEAGHDLYHGRGGYYASNTFKRVSPAEVAKYKRDVLDPVVHGGTNDAEGTTGNASNELGNMVAAHQFRRGTKGYWLNLKTGKKINVPDTYMGGKNEAMFVEGPFKRQLPHRDLLANARNSGVAGTQKIEGDASVRVAFENMPAGAKAYMQHGGMFKTGTVDWGHAMPASDPGGR
jgi:hypothetical protein